jgi:uncharacterized protein (DUF169 family)
LAFIQFKNLKRINGKYTGMVTGPLKSANYEPNLTMIYCNAVQLRHLLFALMRANGYRVISVLDPVGSCVHSVVPSLLTGDAEVTVPDLGECGQPMPGDDQMILTVPARKDIDTSVSFIFCSSTCAQKITIAGP